MFDLEKEVDAWCRAVHPVSFKRKGRIEELKDHLYSAIERYQEDGLSEEEAFLHATGRMGEPNELAKEHSKNSSALIQAACRLNEFEAKQVDKLSHLMNPKKLAVLIIVISLAFAAAIILAAYIVPPEYNQTVMFFLIAIWFIPYAWLTAAAVRKEEKDLSKS
ncbi:MAG: permease prefix domain 1-containing protein [Anaerolineae bacterium]